MLSAGVLRAVLAATLPKEACVTDRVLSLLRERFDEAGETGTELGADMMPVTVGSVLRRPPLSFALRLSARSLCSVKAVRSVARRTSGPGGRGMRRLRDSETQRRDSGGRQAAGGWGTRNDSIAGSSMRAARLLRDS